MKNIRKMFIQDFFNIKHIYSTFMKIGKAHFGVSQDIHLAD